MALNIKNVVRTVFESDMSDIERGAGRGTKAFEGFAGTVTKVGGLLTALATGAFAIFLKSAADASSRAAEVQNLFDVSFGDMADSAEDWAQRTEEAVGVNDTTLKEFAGTLFNMTTAMGLTREGAFELSTGFTELALDTSSFFNIPFDVAFDKIRAGLVGESEPLKQLGVLVTEGTVKQTAFAQAILATGRQLTETEKVQGRAIVIAEGLSNAQGDLIRTSDSWANQTRLVGEAFVDLQETVGQFITDSQLLGSIIASVTEKIRELSGSIEDSSSKWEELVGKGLFSFLRGAEQTLRVIGLLTTGFGGLVFGVGKFIEVLVKLQDMLLRAVTFHLQLTEAGRQVREMILDNSAEALKFAEGISTAGEGTLDLGRNMRASADQMGAAIDDIVDGTGRMGGSVDQLGLIIANLEARQSSLVDQLKGELKQAIEQGGTIPLELYQKVVDNLGGSQELAQDVIGRFVTELKNQRDTTVTVTGATNEMVKAQAALEKKIASLAGSLGVQGLRDQMDLLNDALDRVNESGDQLSRDGLDKILKSMEDLRANNVELTGSLAALSAKFREFGTEALKNLPAVRFETENWNEELEAVFQTVDELAERGDLAEFQSSLPEITTKTADWGNAMSGINDFLSESRGLMTLLGVESDSAFGKILDGISKVFDAFNSLTGIISKVLGLFGGGGGGGGLGGLLGGVGGGGGGIGGLIGGLLGGGGVAAGAVPIGIPGAITGATAATSGAAAGTGFATSFGSAASSGLSSLAGTLAPLFTNPFTIAIGAGIAGFFAVKGLFGGRDAETVMEEAGRDLGVSLSDALAEEIFKSGKNIQLFLPQIFAEGNLGVDRLAEELGDIFSGVEQGLFSIEEGTAALGRSVPDLLANFGQLGAEGTAQVERLLRAAFETGTEFEGMDQVIAQLGQSLLDAAQTGGDAFLSSMNSLGVSGRDSLAFVKNFAQQTGVEFEGLSSIVALLGGQTESTAAMMGDSLKASSIAAGGFVGALGSKVDALTGKLSRAQAAFSALGQGGLSNGGGIPTGIPTLGAAHGVEGRFTGPQAFFVEPGVTEDVSIRRPGSGGGVRGGVTLQFGDIIVQGSNGDPLSIATAVVQGIRQNLALIRSEIKSLANG